MRFKATTLVFEQARGEFMYEIRTATMIGEKYGGH
jgi:hypothetical protein